MSEQRIFQKIRLLLLMSLIACCTMAGIDIDFYSLASIQEFMHTDLLHMQLSVGLYLLGMGISLLFFGLITEECKRKPLIILGLFFASAASFGCALSPDITTFLLARLLQGFSLGICISVARIVVEDISQNKNSDMLSPYFGLFVIASPFLAPHLGQYIQSFYGWQGDFLTLAGVLGMILPLYALYHPETAFYYEQEQYIEASL
jgi:DHA1 family 2-module integral membrane pump EmrD-like MFS transporter